MAKSVRVVSMVCAMARKCQAGCPKKLRCSTTVVSILAAFTAYFENKTRYSRISPGRNGTGAATGAAGGAGGLARFLEGLDCCANPMETNTSTTASSGATEARREKLVRVLNNELVRSGEAGRAGPFQHANLDAVMPPRHAIFRVQNKGAVNQLCRAWCLDAYRDVRVIRKRLQSGNRLFRIGTLVGQPPAAAGLSALAVLRLCGTAKSGYLTKQQ